MTNTCRLDLEDVPQLIAWLDRTIALRAADMAEECRDDSFGPLAEALLDSMVELLAMRRRLLGAACLVHEAPPLADYAHQAVAFPTASAS